MTPLDLIRLALRDAGVNGQGQTPSAEDNNDAFLHLNMMLAQWTRKRWMVFHLVDVSKVSTGATSYTLGTGGDFNTPRTDQIDSAFVRITSGVTPVDRPVMVINAREDYNRIVAKTVGTFPDCVFYDAAYPTGTVYFYPVAAASIYELHLTVKAELTRFPDLTTAINLPEEYQEALLINLGVRLQLSYQLPTDNRMVALAKTSLDTIRGSELGDF